jgi:lipopolysaccharide/colanic/teichoic acid biosynthesis glycosyltransferase
MRQPNEASHPRAALRSKRKRFFDIVSSFSALCLLSPVIILTALCVRIFLGKPFLYRSYRAGLHGEEFLLWKFRTMTNALDSNGEPLPDDQRLPKFGRILRSLSLDELPQLFNILRGEMSLVGPRPLPSIYVDRYSAKQRTRLEVRPGLTGLAQINGRNAASWTERLHLDAHYVASWTFATDVDIIRKTIGKVLQREGVSADGIATGHEFLGDSKPIDDGEKDCASVN